MQDTTKELAWPIRYLKNEIRWWGEEVVAIVEQMALDRESVPAIQEALQAAGLKSPSQRALFRHKSKVEEARRQDPGSKDLRIAQFEGELLEELQYYVSFIREARANAYRLKQSSKGELLEEWDRATFDSYSAAIERGFKLVREMQSKDLSSLGVSILTPDSAVSFGGTPKGLADSLPHRRANGHSSRGPRVFLPPDSNQATGQAPTTSRRQ